MRLFTIASRTEMMWSQTQCAHRWLLQDSGHIMMVIGQITVSNYADFRRLLQSGTHHLITYKNTARK